MKPQFSILALLVLTAYVAVCSAAFVNPRSLWHLVFYGFLVALNLWLIFAAFGKGQLAWFARGFILMGGGISGLSYKVLEFLVPQTVLEIDRSPRSGIITAQFVLLCGLFGGSLALWRYRVLERREKITS